MLYGCVNCRLQLGLAVLATKRAGMTCILVHESTLINLAMCTEHTNHLATNKTFQNVIFLFGDYLLLVLSPFNTQLLLL